MKPTSGKRFKRWLYLGPRLRTSPASDKSSIAKAVANCGCMEKWRFPLATVNQSGEVKAGRFRRGSLEFEPGGEKGR